MEEKREAHLARETGETKIEVRLSLDGTGVSDVKTGIGFLDHMLSALAKHGRFDLYLRCAGDLHVDDHHTCTPLHLTSPHPLHSFYCFFFDYIYVVHSLYFLLFIYLNYRVIEFNGLVGRSRGLRDRAGPSLPPGHR